MWNNTSDAIKQDYGQEFYEKLRVDSICFASTFKGSTDLSQVTNSIVDAVQNQNPKISYLCWLKFGRKYWHQIIAILSHRNQ